MGQHSGEVTMPRGLALRLSQLPTTIHCHFFSQNMGSPSKVWQRLDRIITCRVQSA